MDSKSIDKYIHLGTCFRYLQDVQEGTPIHTPGYVIDNILPIFRAFDEYHLPVTKRASWALNNYYDFLLSTKPSAVLSQDQADHLRKIVSEIRPTLTAETEGKFAYIVTDKRIDVNKLLSDVGALLPPGLFYNLPYIAQYDLNEGGKCIAFERATAAAFHILRGTESVLREYYCANVKRNRTKHLLWGDIERDLSTKRNHDEQLINNLRNIRKNYRNPTQHPDKIYDIQEVQTLFPLCVDVIERMVNSKKWPNQLP